MLGTLLTAIVICMGSMLIGQAALHMCGVRSWTWLAPPVGISVAMLCAVLAVHLPGRATTTSVVLAVAVACALVAAAIRPSERPPVAGLLAGLPILLLTLVPFAANGHAGTLGVSMNNDMAFHLGEVAAYRSAAVARVIELHPNYPSGPSALTAAVAQGLGIRDDEAFAGVTMAACVLLGWTALAALRRGGAIAHVVVGTVTGVPFLVAAYYGQGAFKELLQAALVLALAIFTQRHREWTGAWRWVPASLLVAGMLSVYSIVGLAWPIAIFGTWIAGLAVCHVAQRGTVHDALAALRFEATSVAIAGVTLVIVMVPQMHKLVRFASAAVTSNGTGIAKSDIGNLVGHLPVWEALGVWDNPDFRLPAVNVVATGLWVTAMVLAVAAGTIWWLRRREWVVPAAAIAALVIWALADRTQSPYVSAKALMIASPILVLLAVRALAELAGSDPNRPPVLRIAAIGVLSVLVVRVEGSSFSALRDSKVGPTAHLQELRDIQHLLDGRPTLFVGSDDFIRWELAGSRVDAVVVGYQRIATRPEKPWTYGTALDLDSLDASTLNRYDWIITTRDAAGSFPPDELRLVSFTRSFQLWRRTADITPRSLLVEGPAAGAVLDCSTPAGRQIQRRGGVAAVREPTVSASVPVLHPGSVYEVHLSLGAGAWELQTPYTSQHEIEVIANALRVTMPPNLDRPGARWRIGSLNLAAPETVKVRIRVADPLLEPKSVVFLNAILATRATPPQLVGIGEACGKMVDWFRSADAPMNVPTVMRP